MGLGSIIATNAGTIYGGSGTIYVTLTSPNFFADFRARLGYSSQDEIISVYMTTPTGETYSLGNILGNGSYTDTVSLGYAPAGTYSFTFVSAISTPFEVVAYIYD